MIVSYDRKIIRTVVNSSWNDVLTVSWFAERNVSESIRITNVPNGCLIVATRVYSRELFIDTFNSVTWKIVRVSCTVTQNPRRSPSTSYITMKYFVIIATRIYAIARYIEPRRDISQLQGNFS